MNKYMNKKKNIIFNLRIFWNYPRICRHYFCPVIYVSTHHRNQSTNTLISMVPIACNTKVD
jgi:hypothetical protein